MALGQISAIKTHRCKIFLFTAQLKPGQSRVVLYSFLNIF